MNELAVKKSLIEETSSIAKVYPFRRDNLTGTKESNYLVNSLIGNPAFEGYLKEVVEGIVAKQLIDGITLQQIGRDTPFDSIYISELVPDGLNLITAKKLLDLAVTIEDVSDSIEFNDGWDD